MKTIMERFTNFKGINILLQNWTLHFALYLSYENSRLLAWELFVLTQHKLEVSSKKK